MSHAHLKKTKYAGFIYFFIINALRLHAIGQGVHETRNNDKY